MIDSLPNQKLDIPQQQYTLFAAVNNTVSDRLYTLALSDYNTKRQK